MKLFLDRRSTPHVDILAGERVSQFARAAVILEANAGAARAAVLEPADFINDSFAEPGAPLAR